MTIYNVGALLGSVFHATGAILTSAGVISEKVLKRGRLTIALAYLGVLIFTALLTIASLQGAIPPFFIQGAGPTLLRQMVLGTAVALFAISSLLFMRLYARSKLGLLYWYSLALALIATGLSAVFFQKAVGSPIGWAGRSAQYLGGIYFLVAILTTIRGARARGISLEETIAYFYREAEKHYRALVETVTDAIISIDHQGRVLLWNSTAERMFGHSRGEAVGSLLVDLIVPDRYPDEDKVLEEFVKTGRSPEIGRIAETEVKRKNGEVFPAELSVSVRRTAGGWMGTAIIRDITERKQAEQALQEYAARLEETVKELRKSQARLIRQEKLATLGQLAGGVSHELRNPLGVISNAVYFLQMVLADGDATSQEYLEIITSQVHKAEKIISDLLDFSRTRPAEREEIEVADLVAEVLARHPAPEGVQVSTAIAADLPLVFVDPQQIEQVLTNLVTNAYQAMPEGGGVTITAGELDLPAGICGPQPFDATLRPFDCTQDRPCDPSLRTSFAQDKPLDEPLNEPRDELGRGLGRGLRTQLRTQERPQDRSGIRIQVSDTGGGISPENMEKVFEPLFTTKARGIGLGLAVSKNLVEINGGSIEVESEQGKGSTFTITLPTAAVER